MATNSSSTTSVLECRIFYSWQSDTDSRSFTISALQDAVDALNIRAEKPCNYVADQGCDGDGGALNIATRMLDKIDNCDLYIADLTIVHSAKTDVLIHGRRAPNPNVMFELGYAVKKLGWEKVIMIINVSCGEIELLPFDIKQHRIIPFKHEQNQVTETKNKLIKLMRGMKNDINKQQTDALVSAQKAMQEIEESINNKPSTKNSKAELVKDLTKAIEATETENFGMSNKVMICDVATRVSAVEVAQKDLKRGINLYNKANSIPDKNFPAPSEFLKGYSEAKEWKRWLEDNRTEIMEKWDQPAGNAADILSNLSGTGRLVVKSEVTYESIINLVSSSYPSDKKNVIRHGFH